MIAFLQIILSIVASVLLVIFFICITIVAECLMWFQWRCCKHCHHTLKYRGVKEEDGQEYYLFSCNHCGNWEQVPKEEFFRQYDNL